MTDRLEKANVSKEVSPAIDQYVPVIIGVVVAVVAAALFLLIFYFCMWRKQKEEDAESSLEAAPSFNRKISIVGQEFNQNWMASHEDSAAMSSVGHSSFPAQFTSDEPGDNVEFAMTSVAAPEDETNSNIQDLNDDCCSSSSVQKQQSCHDSLSSLTKSIQHNVNNLNDQVVEATNDSVLCQGHCKSSKDLLSVTGQGLVNPSPISVKLKQKLIQRKRAQEESNSAALVSSYSLDENEVGISLDEQDKTRVKKALNYDNKNLDDNAKINGMSNEINEDSNCEPSSEAFKDPVDKLAHESIRSEEEYGDILPIESPDGGNLRNILPIEPPGGGNTRNILPIEPPDGGNPRNILPILSPDGGSKELDWDSTHEPLKTRSSALKLVCTPSRPKPINVKCPNSNLEDVEASNSDDEYREESIQELDWDSSHEPLKTRNSVLKLVVPQSQ